MNPEHIKKKKRIFLTGATGSIGRNLLFKIIEEDPDSIILLLIRAENQDKAKQRISTILKEKFVESYNEILDKRILVLCGNLSNERFGFTSEKFIKISSSITHIIHCAANVNFNNSIESARKINLFGTKQVIRLGIEAVKSGKLQKIAHISTAYVSGSNDGLIYENDNRKPKAFSNTYEQSKYETEEFIKRHMKKLPLIILRPSIVIGDSKTGKTCSFNVLYSPLKMIQKDCLKYIPGRKKSMIDIVPIDFVTDAAYHIIFFANKEANRIFHLTSGIRSSPKVGEVVKYATDFFNENKNTRHRVKFLSPLFIKLMKRTLPNKTSRILNLIDAYIPYVSRSRVFDNTNTLEALKSTEIKLPNFNEYFNGILKFCLISNWGKNL